MTGLHPKEEISSEKHGSMSLSVLRVQTFRILSTRSLSGQTKERSDAGVRALSKICLIVFKNPFEDPFEEGPFDRLRISLTDAIFLIMIKKVKFGFFCITNFVRPFLDPGLEGEAKIYSSKKARL